MENSVPLSGIPHLNDNEIIAYHEAGHAVMARLFGRCVEYIKLDSNDEGTYNGETKWDRDSALRVWDPNIPYDKLKLRQEENEKAVALIFAAGKVAEQMWYRQRSLDETQASYGSRSGIFNDERQLEIELELLVKFPWLKSENLPKRKQDIEKSAMQLLGAEICWQAVEAVAQALLEGLKRAQEHVMLDDVQNRIADVFARQH
jgi:hypothetical protein